MHHNNQTQAQATRRKTLFPLTPKEILRHQALLAYHLHHNCGLPFYAIRQVLKCSPDRARDLVARAERMERIALNPPAPEPKTSDLCPLTSELSEPAQLSLL